MWVLISHLRCPPGSFIYEQTDGIQHKFEAQSLIDQLAHTVLKFRKANNLGRASFAECLEDIDRYQCQRLGNMPQFCYDTDPVTYVQARQAQRSGGCRGCGARVRT